MKIFGKGELGLTDIEPSLGEDFPGCAEEALALVCRSRLSSSRSFDEVMVKRCGTVAQLSEIEADLGRTLDLVPEHPNLARMHGIVRLNENRIGLVVEPARGQRLTQRLYCLSSPPMSERVEWIRQIVSGLSALHDNHVAHGNLTPDCILFKENGNNEQSNQLMITDYGMTRYNERHVPDWELNQRYAAPEVTSADTCSCQGDIYSLGLILYQLVTLQRLPESRSPPCLNLVSDIRQRQLLNRCFSCSPSERPDLDEILEVFATSQ